MISAVLDCKVIPSDSPNTSPDGNYEPNGFANARCKLHLLRTNKTGSTNNDWVTQPTSPTARPQIHIT